MTTYVELDFETKSLCDLKLCGAWRYAEDVSTEIICLCYRVEGFPARYTWLPGGAPGYFEELVSNPDTIFVAHNAAFEQAIWQHHMVNVYGFPPIPIERWDCTLAACAWKGLPLALDKAGRALRLTSIKDKEGNKLTLSTSKLDKHGNLPELTPAIRQRIIQYCAQDVVVERGVLSRVGLISKESRNERRVWELDQTINQRGVRLDLSFVAAAQAVVDKASAPLRQEFQDLTGITKVGSPKLKDWCAVNGVPVENLQKGYLAELLGETDDSAVFDGELSTLGYDSLAGELYDGGVPLEGVPGHVRRVLEIRGMLGGAAVKKLKRMQACVGYDGRARGLLQYHAAHSGRWGGRLLQPQNFPRESTGFDPDTAVAAIMSGDPSVVERELGLGALDAVARSLRHALVPDPGKVFVVGDYAQIEARIVLALAGQHDKTAMMAGGQDAYVDMAHQIFGRSVEIDKEKRQAGKAAVLGCGFQMGWQKFQATAKRLYQVELDDAASQDVVDTYRKEWAPKVPRVWYALEEASLRAVSEGRETEAYGIRFKPEGEWLTMTLPSGWQKLWYHRPYIGTGRFGNPCWKYLKAKGQSSVPVDMYGGLETENAVQALARGIMCSAMNRLEKAGMPIVLSIHDELICEIEEDLVDEARFSSLMSEPPTWAEDMGIPIAVESWVGNRYRK